MLGRVEDTGLLYTFLHLIGPFGLLFLNLFLCIFEGILNCYAELAHFGDRLFYLVSEGMFGSSIGLLELDQLR